MSVICDNKGSMANVYAYLLNKCKGQYTVAYVPAPTYFQNIIGENKNKIVFVYVENRNTTVSSPDVSLDLPTTNNVGLDLTGSPLKDDCTIDRSLMNLSMDLNKNPWKPEEEFHTGIAVEKIRQLFSDESFQTENNDANGSVWGLCNGTDCDKTLLLEYEFLPEFISRGVVKFGLILLTELSSVESLLQKHFTAFIQNRSKANLETNIENVYLIKPDMLIRCSWSTTAALPALIDLISCDVVLSQTFRLRDCGALTQYLINQLRILTCIREDILAHKEMEANGNIIQEPLYRCGCGIERDDLNESIKKVMTEVCGFVDYETGAEIENDIENIVQKAGSRRSSDLTDKLWDILKRCSSYKDLKTAFHLLFQCAARCNIVNTPSNKNRLAEIIAEVSNRRLAVPCLTGTEPLELLLEIGLEKLYKDYEFIFMQSKICSPNRLKNPNPVDESNTDNGNALTPVRKSLHNAKAQRETVTPRKTLLHHLNAGGRKPFVDGIGFKNSFFDEDATAMQISKLLRIHCTLEHLLMIQINLNLQNVYSDICEQLFNRPLNPLNGNIDESFIDEMNITLPSHYVREQLEGKIPYMRRITFNSSNKFRSCKTSFFYSIENVCPPGINDNSQTSEKEVTKDCVYYSWVYQKIRTRKN